MEASALGPYILSAPIGRGASSLVYAAKDSTCGKHVAIKLFRPSKRLTQDERLIARERFIQEAKILKQLKHDNIVQYIALGDSNSAVPYLVTELVQGQTLELHLAKRGRINPKTATKILYPIAHALDYAHSQGIVHRDLKPGNILIGPHLEPKLIDFGVARSADSGLTNVGEILGTISYLSPEQLNGERASKASDLFSLALITFEILTGRVPFGNGAGLGVVDLLAGAAPEPASKICQEFSTKTDEVFKRALATEPKERYPNATSLVEDLARAINADLNEQPRQAIHRQKEKTTLRAEAFGNVLEQRNFGKAPIIKRAPLSLHFIALSLFALGVYTIASPAFRQVPDGKALALATIDSRADKSEGLVEIERTMLEKPDSLLLALADPEMDVESKKSIIRSASLSQNATFGPIILNLAEDSNSPLQLTALRYLPFLELNDARLLPVLESAVVDSDRLVRAYAVRALGRIDSLDAELTLLSVSENEKDKLVLQACRAALIKRNLR